MPPWRALPYADTHDAAKMSDPYLSIAGLAGLPLALLGEADAEHAQHIAVSGLYVHVCLDEALPLANKRTDLVGGEGHAPEVGEA